MKNKSDSKKKICETPCMYSNDAQPENVTEQINRYGTYNIQPTNSSDNTYPAIAQGLDKKEAERLEKEKDRWLKEDSKVPQRPGN